MKKKILVVDNHPVILKFMTSLLEKDGYQVLTAKDGITALDILETYTPDVIFVDLVMPNVNGEKLCQIIRGKMDDVYLVILSNIAAEQELNLNELGADACIAKGPFHKMAQHVLTVLDQTDRETSAIQQKEIIGLEDIDPREITKELLSVKRHNEIILGSMAEGILEITPEARIVYANPTAVSLIHVPENKLLGSNFIALFRKNERQRIKDLVERIGTTSQIISEDSPVKLNSKQVSLKMLPLKDAENKSIIIVINDVSDRKRMEVQLLQAQKFEAIGTLAGGIAHEFNNLLMAIQGNASLMLLTIDSTHPYYERLKSIEKLVHSGSKLTGQILGYARKGRYEVRPLNLNKLVEETADIFGRTKKEIRIHQELFRDLFAIEADAAQIQQVLMNLFVNAADAMPSGGDLYLETASITHKEIKGKPYEPKPGNYVMLTVRDIGIGMDKKTMAHIFDPFFTTKERGKGTGLGLSSVYGIIKGHGGYIDVESEKGHGTIFMIYLPASEKKIQEPLETFEQTAKIIETILLVDDENIVLQTGRDLLKAMGYRVFVARNGREALQIYTQYQDIIDLILLDVVMPHMGGGEVFDRLREINPHVKVLLSSGYSIDGEATEILNRGCSGFIQKPYDMKQLLQSIRMIFEEKGEDTQSGPNNF